MNIIEIRYVIANDTFLDVLQSATLIILEYVFGHLPVEFLAREVVNSSVMGALMHRKP